MAELDILARDQCIEDPIYLEACAGAGKTFTIEHLVVRLLCHPDQSKRRTLDQIALITFTRAAARDLKRRLQSCLITILDALKHGGSLPSYLQEETPERLDYIQRCLTLALFCFDRAWISTIHGFCSRLLKKFGMGLIDLVRASQTQGLPEAVEQEWILEFLRYGVPESEVGRGQWLVLGHHFRGPIQIADNLRKREKKLVDSQPWSELQTELMVLLHQAPSRNADCWHGAWCSLAPYFRKLANRQGQIHSRWQQRSAEFAQLIEHPTERGLESLVQHGCPWIEAFQEDCRKQRMGDLPHDSFAVQALQWCQQALEPSLQRARNPYRILGHLQRLLTPLHDRWLAEAGGTQPDQLIQRVEECSQSSSWCAKVGQEVRTLIVDEFQDTDPHQWMIFSRLQPHLQLVLVGDPKQSIYAFRQADLYTYLEASRSFDLAQRWTLTRCWRSSEAVIQAINWCMSTLEGMDLPRLGHRLAVPPTLPGGSPPAPTALPAMLWSLFSQSRSRGRWPSRALMEDQILPSMVQAIRSAASEGISWERMVVIVRDRYQASTVAARLASAGIPTFTSRGRAWSERRALPILRDLIESLCHPEEEASLLRLLSGPLGAWGPNGLHVWRLHPLLPKVRHDLTTMRNLLMNQGLMAAVDWLSKTRWSPRPRSPKLELEWSEVMRDLVLLAESLSSLEQKTPSLGLLWNWTLQEVMAGRMLLPEEAAPSPPGAIQIMTIHTSKGLEFDAVFALGLCSRTPPSEDDSAELDAEKLRQFYVAITRAKRFIWMPYVCDLSGKPPRPGECAPVELLAARVIAQHEGRDRKDLQTELQALGTDILSVMEQWISKSPEGCMGIQAAAEPELLLPHSQEESSEASSILAGDWPAQRLWSSFTAEAHSVRSHPVVSVTHDTASNGSRLPSGKAFGVLWHECIHKRLVSQKPLSIAWIEKEISQLNTSSGEISLIAKQVFDLIEVCLQMPVWQGYALRDCAPHQIRSEVPFLLKDHSEVLMGWKGSIDIVAELDRELILMDWKTHDLGDRPEDYRPERLRQCIFEGDYALQARLYLAAVRAAGWKAARGHPRTFLFIFVRGVLLGVPAIYAVTDEDLHAGQ
jgi:exodeoxyribonuclease V beta subunit